MITEDYVSFETAKLLKEKGFPLPSTKFEDWVFCMYDENGDIRWGCYHPDYYCRVTLQMAMKWLREDKKILTSIFCHIDKGYWFCIQHFIDSPYKFATSESIHRKEEILGKIQYYDTYEQACEAAIKYCLENIILN